MKRAECDQCKTLVNAADMIYGTPPKGWLQITKQGEYPGKDFCSVDCAARYLEGQRPPATETPIDLSKIDEAMEIPPAAPVDSGVNVELDTL